MGCCSSSPYSKRKYRVDDDDDDDIDHDQPDKIRYFGKFRSGSNLVPDDVEGLSSTHIHKHLLSNPAQLLYEVEIDHGKGCRIARPVCLLFCTPIGLVMLSILKVAQNTMIPLDEICCWVRKEYSTRTFLRIYSNRIESNNPGLRCPFGLFGCGSWNSDNIIVNQFDRGAFGFSVVKFGSIQHLCCCWQVYGGVVARHRCQCFGPFWGRNDYCGWWCDEWCCKMFLCTKRYSGIANADEMAFAASIALQAYFESRIITRADMDLCIEFWNHHISERTDPIGRKRAVCCEPYHVRSWTCTGCYKKYTHMERNIPFQKKHDIEDGQEQSEVKPFVNKNTPDDNNDEQNNELISKRLIEVYKQYKDESDEQIDIYEKYHGPVAHSTICRSCGCRRFFGRKGVFFCTEGSCCEKKEAQSQAAMSSSNLTKEDLENIAPPMTLHHDFDDEWDASTVLHTVLGPPPSDVVIRRWRWDPDKQEHYLHVVGTEQPVSV